MAVRWVYRVVSGINMIKYLYCRIGPQFATLTSFLSFEKTNYEDSNIIGSKTS
jgi:hypothetical protein